MPVILDSSSTDTAPLASKLLSARGAAELALQKVGAYSPNDDGADPNELDRALQWMELEIAEMAEVYKPKWLVPATMVIALTADAQSFDLADAAGADYPALGMAYPISAAIIYPNDDADELDRGTPIDMRRRSDYESVYDRAEAGAPDFIYIDRQNDRPQVYLHRVPADDLYSLRLVVQTYARSVLGDLGDNESGDVQHGFARGWQKWLVNQTAQAIGNGPVRRLDGNTLKDIRAEAANSLQLLLRTQNRENVSMRLKRTRRYGA